MSIIILDRFWNIKIASIDKILYFSGQFSISCDTVSIDVTRSKVLLIRW